MSHPGSIRSLTGSGTTLGRPILAMVTDSRLYGTHVDDDSVESRCAGVAAAAGRAARAGVTLIQIRERSLEAASLLDLAGRVRRAIDGTPARMLINDRVDVALGVGADGVHLPASAPGCARVREIVPESFLIGRSVHSQAEAVAVADSGGCDYLVFGTVFPSRSKPSDHPVAGLDTLARVCRSVSLPVLAIGGITTDRIAEVAEAGAAGIAAIGLFALGAQDELDDRVARIHRAFDRT